MMHFVDVVFGYPEGFVPVRVLSETGTRQAIPRSEFHQTGAIASALTRLALGVARDGRGLNVVPGTVAVAGSARARDIVQTAAILIDPDAGDMVASRKHLEQNPGPATLVVASGRKTNSAEDKLHLCWRLTRAASQSDLERVRALREVIAVKVGGDPSFKSPHQPIRVPGTIHGKNSVRTAVRIVASVD